MPCISSVLQTGAVIQPCKGVLFLQNMEEYALQNKKLDVISAFMKQCYLLLPVKDSEQDYFKNAEGFQWPS